MTERAPKLTSRRGLLGGIGMFVIEALIVAALLSVALGISAIVLSIL